jgi:Protein of unknown function (DUF5672)
MLLDLSSVTLVTFDRVCQDLTVMAIEDCLKHALFGEILFFTDKSGWKYSTINRSLDGKSANLEYAIYKLPGIIKTSHVLFMQWDGWVIDPGMWTDDFYTYDYIGSPWWYKCQNVGNGGFCLKSTELMRFIALHREEFPITLAKNEDDMLCRVYQKQLPQFKWAPTSVATKFSFERTRNSIESRHFGFHGMFNWPFVLSPDRLAERMAIARSMPYLTNSHMMRELDDVYRHQWLAPEEFL